MCIASMQSPCVVSLFEGMAHLDAYVGFSNFVMKLGNMFFSFIYIFHDIYVEIHPKFRNFESFVFDACPLGKV